ncbi:MAG: type II toxin-antitoxin system RelE/ParE family toxin [bacterium]|nr:type II toxin-antitoxin system RelE/ParE family toxin [bacterium]
MKVHDVIVLSQVKEDLIEGKEFYDSNEAGIGSYFFDNIVSDIESLKLYAGIHSKHHGLYRMLSRKFPFAIYYDIKGVTAIVVAVLDLRRNPAWIRKRLKERFC